MQNAEQTQPPIELAQRNVIAWRDQVKAALISFERTRTINTAGRLSIPTAACALELHNQAHQITIASRQLTEAIDSWIRAQHPPLNVPGITDNPAPFPEGP